MIRITRENIVPYLKEHMPDFDDSAPAAVSIVGEGCEEEDGDGYVNYIFRVRTDKCALVLKQALLLTRITQQEISLDRNRLEYDGMRIFHAIAPEYVPYLCFQDEENHIFVMEDVSDLKIVRFAFNKNEMFPKFGQQCGEYLARTEFYTSEYYLDRKDYRKLQYRFDNTELRQIMEDGMFLDRFDSDTDTSLGKPFADFADKMGADSRFQTELFKLRRSFMSHADALIHADFHTSNLFASKEKMKVIDMEFAFMGPFGYDPGYLAGNLISQYAAACFKEFPSEQERQEFKAYLLATLKSLIVSYIRTFTLCWEKDAKERYQGQQGLLTSIFEEVIRDAPGYAAMVNWFRASSGIPYPDFDVIQNEEARRNATVLSLFIDWDMMFGRYQYRNVDDWIEAILTVEKKYMLGIGRK